MGRETQLHHLPMDNSEAREDAEGGRARPFEESLGGVLNWYHVLGIQHMALKGEVPGSDGLRGAGVLHRGWYWWDRGWYWWDRAALGRALSLASCNHIILIISRLFWTCLITKC